MAEDIETIDGAPQQQVFLVGKTAYVDGNLTALMHDGFSGSLATRAQNRWIALAPKDGPYRAVSGHFVVGGYTRVLGGLPFFGPYAPSGTSRTYTTSGRAVATTVIDGWAVRDHSAQATLFVRQAKPHLPTDYEGRFLIDGAMAQVDVQYSFHKQAQDPRPRHAVAWSALVRSAHQH